MVVRYIGEVGDLVVGRITEVGSKRWKVSSISVKHLYTLRVHIIFGVQVPKD